MDSINFFQSYNFAISPAEFLACVWVVRKEILPVIAKVKGCSITEEQCIDKDVFRKIRSDILNGTFSSEYYEKKELCYFSHQALSLYAVFIDVKDNVHKPDQEEIIKARDVLASIIVPDIVGNLPTLKSSLHEGKIEFQLQKLRLL